MTTQALTVREQSALVSIETQKQRSHRLKMEWQRRDRDSFKKHYGYGKSLFYRFGGNREAALMRDNYCCVKCGMSDAEHKVKWGRPITVDHKDKNANNNVLDNLQTLCLICHGRKDISPRLVIPHCIHKKDEILSLRSAGHTYQEISRVTGFSIGAVYRWINKWNKNTN